MSGNKISDRPILPLKARKAVFEKLEDIADVVSMTTGVPVSNLTEAETEQKGMKEGMEKGIKEGAQKAQLQIARNMKAKGIDNQSIAECTDLPLSMIEEL